MCVHVCLGCEDGCVLVKCKHFCEHKCKIVKMSVLYSCFKIRVTICVNINETCV